MASVSLREVSAAEREHQAILWVVSQLRKDVRFASCPIIAAVECLNGIQASHIDRNLQAENIPGLCIMNERAGYLTGVPKTSVNTNEYLAEIRNKLSTNYLVYSDDLLAYGKKPPKQPPPGLPIAEFKTQTVLLQKKRQEKNAARLKLMLKEQMKNLRILPKNRNQDVGDQSYHITAKIGDRVPDDLLIALEMCCYWRGVFIRDEKGKYKEWHRLIPNFGREVVGL